MQAFPVRTIEQAIRKRKCRSCYGDIPAGQYCLVWTELGIGYYARTHGRFVKVNLCLDCAHTYIKDNIKQSRLLSNKIKYRKAHRNRVRRIISKSK